MKGGSRPLGYTIIEVMIVLAVSGLMFIMAATFISGKQGKTAFSEGTSEFASQLQAVIEQVSSGSYSDVSLKCTSNGAKTVVTAGSTQQGKNQECVFLGKIVYLQYGSANSTDYRVFSVAGARISTATPNKTLAPVDVDPAVADVLTQQKVVPQNLNINTTNPIRIKDASGANRTSSTFAFLQSLGSTDSNGEFNSGSQNISLYYVKGVVPGTTTGIDGIVSSTATGGNLLPAQSVTICLNDGSRYADVTLGANNGGQLSVTVTRASGASTC